MLGHYVFLDPDDRSRNEPSTIMSQPRVLGLYKQLTGESMEKVTDKVKDKIEEEAKKLGWSEVEFTGGQCILTEEF